MIDRPARVVKFVSAELSESSKDRCVARVELRYESDRACVATVEGGCSEVEGFKSVAQATANALLQAVNSGEDSLDIRGVEIKEAFGKRTVLLSIAAYYYRQQRELLGFCVIDENPPRAAALAVLNATNRFLGVG